MAMVVHVQERRTGEWQIRPISVRGLMVTVYAGSRVILCCLEKFLARFEPPVPQTDSGG